MDNYVDAYVKVKVPKWQIGQEASVYFKDTMCVKGICEAIENLEKGDNEMRDKDEMRDKERIDSFLKEVGILWKKNVPDWRFMQLICNLQSACGSDMFYMEEDRFLAHLRNYFDSINTGD